MGGKSNKIVLIEPTGRSWNNSFYLGESCFDPVQLGYLSSFLRQSGHDVAIFQQRGETDEEVADFVRSQNPTIVGFSTMTFNFNRGRRIAKALKSMDPSVRTVFGGYHVTANVEASGFPEIDFLVVGEGERTFEELADCITEGSEADLKKVAGICYKNADYPTRRSRITDLDSLPFPERYGLDSCRMGAPMIPAPEKQNSFAQVTYSRGCYYSCSFCASPAMWQGGVVHRSAGNMADEIEYLVHEFGTNGLFFTDLTFNANRQKVIELCDELGKRDINISWSASCRITDDAELLEKMKEAGCKRISYGVESLDDRVLHELRKGITTDDIIRCFEITNEQGMIARAYTMMGYPGESRRSVAKTVHDIKKLPADHLRVSFVTPFPGTRLYEEMKAGGLILSDNADDYDTDIPVIRTELTQEELLEARKQLLRSFYTSPEYRYRLERKGEKFPYLRPAYDSFLGRLKTSIS